MIKPDRIVLPEPLAAERERDLDRSLVRRLTSEVRHLKEALARRDRRIALLEAASREDALTGLVNRRGFIQDLERAIGFVRRYGTVATLLYIDFDGFKAVNDQFGHAAGDVVLAALAKRLAAHVRVTDLAGRLGGDEFAIMLWQSDRAAAEAKAAALAAHIAAEPVKVGGVEIRISASIGVTTVEADDDAERAIARADDAMYTAKRQTKAGAV